MTFLSRLFTFASATLSAALLLFAAPAHAAATMAPVFVVAKAPRWMRLHRPAAASLPAPQSPRLRMDPPALPAATVPITLPLR